MSTTNSDTTSKRGSGCLTATVKIAEGRCFLCKTTEQVFHVKMKDQSFTGLLCSDHLYEQMQPEVPRVVSQQRSA